MANSIKVTPKLNVIYTQTPPTCVRWGSVVVKGIPMLAGLDDHGHLCRLSFVVDDDVPLVLANWVRGWKKTRFAHDPKAVAAAMKGLKAGHETKLRMIGTAFQCAVWKNLLAIPHGETVTYAELARRSKRPKAVRAVGTACGANPVAILVPCHRVLASHGGLGGFGGGLANKKKLLQAEGVQQLSWSLASN